MKRLSLLLLVGLAACVMPFIVGCSSGAKSSAQNRISTRPYINPASLTVKDKSGKVLYTPDQKTLDTIAKLNASRLANTRAPK